jgi:hypothetical protein
MPKFYLGLKPQFRDCSFIRHLKVTAMNNLSAAGLESAMKK